MHASVHGFPFAQGKQPPEITIPNLSDCGTVLDGPQRGPSDNPSPNKIMCKIDRGYAGLSGRIAPAWTTIPNDCLVNRHTAKLESESITYRRQFPAAARPIGRWTACRLWY